MGPGGVEAGRHGGAFDGPGGTASVGFDLLGRSEREGLGAGLSAHRVLRDIGTILGIGKIFAARER